MWIVGKTFKTFTVMWNTKFTYDKWEAQLHFVVWTGLCLCWHRWHLSVILQLHHRCLYICIILQLILKYIFIVLVKAFSNISTCIIIKNTDVLKKWWALPVSLDKQILPPFWSKFENYRLEVGIWISAKQLFIPNIYRVKPL